MKNNHCFQKIIFHAKERSLVEVSLSPTFSISFIYIPNEWTYILTRKVNIFITLTNT